MYKILFYFFACFFLIGCTHHSDRGMDASRAKAYSGFIIFEATKGFDIFYDPHAVTSVQEKWLSGTVVINGSYFGMTASGSYYPAGLWIYNKEIKNQSIYNDPNLSHIVGISETGAVTLFPVHLYKESSGSDEFAFQAGPLVLSGNVIQDFGPSWHANQKHERTLLGKTQSGKLYFFVFSYPVSLSEAGNHIANLSDFANDPITLVNLDGGPSTAYFDGKNGFRSGKHLPLLFRIR